MIKVDARMEARKLSAVRSGMLNIVLATAGSMVLSATALAQPAPRDNPGDYPNRPIRILMSGSGGGSTDVITRLVTQKLGERWGQPFLVENMSGASGAIAAETAARAAPNGYTLYAMSSSSAVAAAVEEKNARSINFRTAYAPITQMVSQPYVAVVNATVPVTSIKELIAYAKGKPGALNYGSLGIGSATHMGTELFKSMAGIDMVHVPYKGTNQVEGDLVAGHIQMLFGGAQSSMPMVKSGKTRALALTSAKRSKLLPDLPTIAETGLPGFDLDAWFGLAAPAGTPQAVLLKIHVDAVRILNTPEVRDKLAAGGSETAPSDSPATFGAFVNREMDKWEKFVKTSGIKF